MSDEQARAPSRSVTVWDLPLRALHWVLVLLVALQVTTAQIGGNALEYHALGGYVVLTLVLFRVLWGFFGGTHARFADFLRSPATVWRYVRGRSPPGPGHNPLGGWSVLLMLASLLVQGATGLFANDDVMTEGPLAKHVSDETSALATAIHDGNAVVLLALIAVHLLAVSYYLFVKKQNLIRPMLNGRKEVDAGIPPPRPGSVPLAILLLGIAAAAVWQIVTF